MAVSHPIRFAARPRISCSGLLTRPVAVRQPFLACFPLQSKTLTRLKLQCSFNSLCLPLQNDFPLGSSSPHLRMQGVFSACSVHPPLWQHLLLLLQGLLPTKYPEEWKGSRVCPRQWRVPGGFSDSDELQELQAGEVQGGRDGRGEGGQGGEKAWQVERG